MCALPSVDPHMISIAPLHTDNISSFVVGLGCIIHYYYGLSIVA